MTPSTRCIMRVYINIYIYIYRYLETFKAYEHKGCESIQERVDAEYGARWVGARGAGRARGRRGGWL